MFDRLRQSLALRLAWQYALMFALCVAMLFGERALDTYAMSETYV